MGWFLPLLLAAGGAAASNKANKDAAKERYEIQRRQQEAANDQIARQNMHDKRMMLYQQSHQGDSRAKLQQLTDEGYDRFNKSLAFDSRENQDAIGNAAAERNTAELQSVVSDTPVMGALAAGSAPTVKAAAKATAQGAKTMRGRMAGLGRFGALSRDRGLANAIDNAEASGVYGIINNKMRGETALMGQLSQIQPTRADYIPPARLRHKSSIDNMRMLGQIGMAVGGSMLGGSVAAAIKGLGAGTAGTVSGSVAGTGLGTAGNLGGTMSMYGPQAAQGLGYMAGTGGGPYAGYYRPAGY